jgi:hypothetical protein
LARLNLTTFRKNIEDEKSAHNALNDCIIQILALKESYTILGL